MEATDNTMKDNNAEIVARSEEFNAERMKLLHAFQAIAKGDLSFEYKSADPEITAAMNQVVSVLKKLSGSTDMVLLSLSKGELSGRMAKDLPGEYGAIATKFNRAIDVYANTCSIAATGFDKFSKGDIPQKVTDVFPGEFGKMADDLNRTIDGYIGIREANKVLQGMATNDYSTKVEGNYIGVFNDLGQAVNLTRERILHVTETIQNISEGNIEDLDKYKALNNGKGKRSDNDKLVPAMIKMMQTV
ncbi:MAG: hypothetical protein LUQ09_06625, partial [Methanomassiliicoccales archaeon]|nr:hypothetical protein [Methanomassiliicoccales archaeon]